MADVKRLATPTGTPPRHHVLTDENHAEGVLRTLRDLYEHGDLCDYTIHAEGQSFPAHRLVLAAVSDYFRVMLMGDMLEAHQDHVELKGVSAAGVTLLLDYAYTGSLHLTLDDVMDVLAGACHLQMQSAISLCCNFMTAEIGVKTCVDLLNIAEMFSLGEVEQFAIKFVISHFGDLADTDQFFKLRENHLCEILESEMLDVPSELVLFELITRWVRHDESERLQYAAEVLQHVRFALMSPEELVDRVSTSSLITADPQCRTFLDEALHYHVLPQRQPLMQTPRTRVRGEPALLAFGGRYGMGIGYKHNSCKMYVLHENRWLPLQDANHSYLYSAVAVIDNFLYVCGGMGKPAHARSACYRFDPRTLVWTELAPMRTRRQSFPLVAHEGKLYAFGGGIPCQQGLDHPPTSRCEVYSIDRNEWTQITPLPEKSKSASACVYKSRIYVSGGRTENETLSTLWSYEIASDKWSTHSPMLLSHAGHAMLPYNNKIYVIDRGHSGVESYDPVTDDWTKVVPPLGTLSGVARPAINPPWVYFLSYVQETNDFLCKRLHVGKLESEDLPPYPEPVHCLIGAPLVFPRHALVDANNNP